jgi:hypothetical protein
MRRGGLPGAQLVRSVQQSLDDLTRFTTTGSNGASSSTSVVEYDRDARGNAVSTSNASDGDLTRSDIDPDLLALVLLCGMRGTEERTEGKHILRAKSEEKLLDAALHVLCEPHMAARWWWK